MKKGKKKKTEPQTNPPSERMDLLSAEECLNFTG